MSLKLDPETIDLMTARLDELYFRFEDLVREFDDFYKMSTTLGGLGREMEMVMREICEIENLLDVEIK
jgi:division protein CdvB (Snf7/Vps24/ESCRT-III family)